MINRAIVIVLDGFGVGEAPDADIYGDLGSNTLKGIYDNTQLEIPNMKKMGLYNINDIGINEVEKNPIGAYGKAKEQCVGKNSPVGHWEMSGFILRNGFSTYPNAFPKKLVDEFIKKAGIKGILCNEVGSRNRDFKTFWRRAYKNRISNNLYFCR